MIKTKNSARHLITRGRMDRQPNYHDTGDDSLKLVGYVDKSKERYCLKCDSKFLSHGPQNRLCPRCCGKKTSSFERA